MQLHTDSKVKAKAKLLIETYFGGNNTDGPIFSPSASPQKSPSQANGSVSSPQPQTQPQTQPQPEETGPSDRGKPTASEPPSGEGVESGVVETPLDAGSSAARLQETTEMLESLLKAKEVP